MNPLDAEFMSKNSRRETLDALHEAQKKLNAANERIRDFVRQHMIVLNGRSVIATDRLSQANYAALATELKNLFRNRDRAHQEHQRCMAEYAQIKTEAA
jgi:hypothetical protein